MLNSLIQICNKLGVAYPDLDSYNDDCQKVQYLIDCISKFIG